MTLYCVFIDIAIAFSVNKECSLIYHHVLSWDKTGIKFLFDFLTLCHLVLFWDNHFVFMC